MFGKTHFMIVDDQPFIRSIVQGMLLRLGAQNFTLAANGQEALDALKHKGNSIKCVISDWNMSPVDGLQLLREIRTGTLDDVPADLCFIMFTGFATSNVVTSAMNLDVSAYLVKPTPSSKLAQCIKMSLAKSIKLQPPAFYRTVPMVDLPHTVESPEAKGAAWTSWVKGGKQVYLAGETNFINRDAVEMRRAPASSGTEIRNIRHKTADRIKPGAILIEDYRDGNGVVLLNAGTILSEKILTRLQAITTETGARPRLWVGRQHPT